MPRLYVLAALLAAVTVTAQAQSAGGSAETRRAYSQLASRAQARMARLAVAAPVFEASQGGTPTRTIASGTVLLAYRSELGRVAVATPQEGALGWVEASQLVIGTRTEAPTEQETGARIAALTYAPEAAAARTIDRRAATYDSLMALPPSALAPQDLRWLELYQEDRRTRASERRAQSGATAAGALKTYVGVVVGLVVLGVVLGVAAN